MGNCTLFSDHKLRQTYRGSNLVRCDRCRGMWDITGREMIPFGYDSWKAWEEAAKKQPGLPSSAPEPHYSGATIPLEDIALAVANGLIKQDHVHDRAEMKRIREAELRRSGIASDEKEKVAVG